MDIEIVKIDKVVSYPRLMTYRDGRVVLFWDRERWVCIRGTYDISVGYIMSNDNIEWYDEFKDEMVISNG